MNRLNTHQPTCGRAISETPKTWRRLLSFANALNSKQSLDMNAFQWLVFTVFLLLLGCANAAPSPSEALPLRHIAKRNFSGFTEATNQVIMTKADWEPAWTKLGTRAKDSRRLSAVDFSREMVILVTMGQQHTGGYSVEITKVEEAEGKLRIYVKRSEPAPSAFTLQAITAPFHAVAVPKRDSKPDFIEVKANPQ